MHPSPVGRIAHRLHHLGLGAETQLASGNAKIHRTLQTRTGQLRRDSRTRHQPPFANTQGPPRVSSIVSESKRTRRQNISLDRGHLFQKTTSDLGHATANHQDRRVLNSSRCGVGALDANPPRQRRTRWLVLPASESKGSFCATIITAPWASTNPNARSMRKVNTSPKERDGENLPTNTGFKNTADCQSLGWSPASSWVGGPAGEREG